MVFGEGTVDRLNVRITGNSNPFRREMGRAKRAAGGFGRFAKGAMKTAAAGTAAAAGAAGLAAKEYTSFEQALAEVEKAADAETAAGIADGLQRMAEEVPLAQEQLAGLAADAARFGVEGKDNILEFTRVAGEMGAAFPNLAADRAAEAIAKIGELTDTPIEKSRELGSTINSLGNEAKTSSGEIVDAMLKSSGALNQLGADTAEIAALNATINETSESARRGGTRLRRLAQEMMEPDKVEELASALGMTPDQFKAIRAEDPVGLMRDMAETMAEGGEGADLLRSTLGTASRTAITGLAQNLDGLHDNLEVSNEQMDEGSSLARELGIETDTTAGKAKLLRNRMGNVGITLGEGVVDNVVAAADGFGKAFGPDTQGMVDATAGLLEDTVDESAEVGEMLGEGASKAADFIDNLTGDAETPAGVINNLIDELDGINWTKRGKEAGNMAAQMANDLVDEIDDVNWSEAGTIASDFAVGLGGALETFLEETDWGDFGHAIGAGLREFLEGVNWGDVLSTIGRIEVDLVAATAMTVKEFTSGLFGFDKDPQSDDPGGFPSIRRGIESIKRELGITDPDDPKGMAARGGIVTRPTSTIVGEAGPEAIVPLDRKSGARPLPNHTRSANNQGNGVIARKLDELASLLRDLTIEADGRTIARLVDHHQARNARFEVTR